MTSPATVADLGAVVVVLRGGAALSQALDGVAWAASRTVLDPGDLAVNAVLPPGVARARDAAAAIAANPSRTVLLLSDLETVPTPLVAVLEAAALRDHAAALRCAYVGDAIRLTPRRRSVRLAPRATARIGFDRRLGLTLLTPAPVTHLDDALEVALVPDVAAATDALEAETRALARLLWCSGRRPTVSGAAGAAIAAGWSLLSARAVTTAPQERWIVAVLTAYRAVLTHARLWELAYAAGTAA